MSRVHYFYSGSALCLFRWRYSLFYIEIYSCFYKQNKSNNFAVSSGDIGQGLTAAGAALNTYGNSFEETIGLVTAGEMISCPYRLNCWKAVRAIYTTT